MTPTALRLAGGARSTRREVALPNGHLWMEIERADEPVDALCGFGARAGNGRRPFLVVSRVLGKHIPVRPSRMAQVHDRLAMRIPTDLEGPVLFVGLAETATGLGEGVFERYRGRTARNDLWFAPSTRHPELASEKRRAIHFLEPHSHAPDHWVVDGESPLAFATIRSAVLVDDEITTGQTLRNLSGALRGACPRLSNIVRVTITDWSAGNDPDAVLPFSLVRGTLGYAPSPGPGESASHERHVPEHDAGPGPAPIEIPASIHEHVERLGVGTGTRTLVVGAGEYLHRPYQLATALEARGAAVWFQSTTRSPALVHGAIRSALSFPDPADGNATRFLYNADRTRYDRVFVCRPSANTPVAAQLLSALGAELLTLA